MGIRVYKPTSAGRRNASVNDYAEITKTSPEKTLVKRIKKHGGRNHSGKTTVRFRGGGARRIYRMVDFKRLKDNVVAKVVAIEYDPNRTCHIALLQYADDTKSYILAPLGLKVGEELESGDRVEPKVGNCMPLKNIPNGMDVHNVELNPGQGGRLVRSAGSVAKIAGKEEKYVTLIMPSGEMRMVRSDCRATIGQIGNPEHQLVVIGKAGRKRHMGRKPHVRGKAMNPVDHPMGGGEGRSNGGRHPCSPTGLLAKGGKTRAKRKVSNKHIIRRRKSKHYGQLVL
ncbi:MAG: 50S ribosomal protein L2 [Sedimentisphaerales bacterium]|nr:50S ribosomal protein L2 [Sedimentisphaerales bacterium]